MNREAPIGIFDSGIGGLTVANAIQKKLPKENIIYFGDTKHLPYGEKSPDAIIRFSKKITSFLLNNKCKIIIIACNTASSVAYEVVKKSAQNIPVVNVIDPVINSLTEFNQNKIGIIGTKRTILSNIYNDKLILKNNELYIKNIDTQIDECNQFLPILALFSKLLSDESDDENEIKNVVEAIFTEYLEFIDSIVQYMFKKQCFQDQYLILLSEIEKNIEKINQGLIKLINTHRKDKLSVMYKSILFSFFDFSKLLIEIKSKVNTENTNFKSIKKLKNERTYSF